MTALFPDQNTATAQCCPELKQQILAAIAEHIRRYGRHQWDLVREKPQFAAVIGKQAGKSAGRKFFRWADAVSKPTPPDKTRPHEGREVANEAMEVAERRARLVTDQHLPAAPLPGYFLRAGADAERNFDLLTVLNQTCADAERLRDHAMRADEAAPGGAIIVNEKAFDASIRRRLELIETAVSLRREIYDLEHYERFYRTLGIIVTEELAGVPEIQERVLRRLAEFSRAQGMVGQAGVR